MNRFPALALLLLAVSPLCAELVEGKRLPWPPTESDPAACAALAAEAEAYLGGKAVFSRFDMGRGHIMVYADRVRSPGRKPAEPQPDFQPVLKAAQACVGPDVEFWGGGDDSSFILQVPAPAQTEAKRRREGLRGRLGLLLESLGSGF